MSARKGHRSQIVTPPSATIDPTAAVDLFVAVSTALSEERSLPCLLDRILSAARGLIRAGAGRIYGLDQTKQHLIPLVVHDADGPLTPDRVPRVPIYLDRVPNLTNAYAFTATTGRLLVVADIHGYTGFDFADELALDRSLGRRTRSVLTAPLRNHENTTIGLLQLSHLPDGTLTADGKLELRQERLLTAFASQAAITLSNRRLIDQNAALIEALDGRNRELSEENQRLRSEIAKTTSRKTDVIGESPAMLSALSLVEKVAGSKVTVLLLGETGTGKEVFAKTLHRMSSRRDGPFIAQNCAAVPEALLENELFGHRRGAFTGATADKPGIIQTAKGGTLFLDEIGDMPLGLQAKLLRVLQENEVRPIGATRSEPVDVRVIAATNVDLRDKISRGEFREDLYYRLNIFPIQLPPLRDRQDDILRLAEHFLQEAAQTHGRRAPSLTKEAFEILMAYPFPGNVRELRNIVERALLLCEDGHRIGPELFPAEVQRAGGKVSVPGPVAPEGPLKTAVEKFEAWVIAARLSEAGGNQTEAAKLLGISRRSLVEKIGRYGVGRRRVSAARAWEADT